MTIQAHDFSQPPSLHPETRAKLAAWLSRACKQLAEAMGEFGLKTEVKLQDCSTAWPFNTLQEWSDKSLAYQLTLGDVASPSVVAVPNPLAQALIGALLGEQFKTWPEERGLTPGEDSVADFLISRIVSTMVDSWQGEETINLKIGNRESNLRRSKTFKFSEPFVICRISMKTDIGSGEWCWMLPHQFLTKLFGSVRAASTVPAVTVRRQLETLAKDMSTEFTIRLGSVLLSPPQLAELRVGDLVVLNQKTSEPLRAMVSGRPRFLGWPGRVGNRQAFEIAADGSRREQSAETATDSAATAQR